MNNDKTEYLTAGQVRSRFGGTSRMWLHRRLVKDSFPTPVTFGGRFRFFKLADVQAWERSMIARGIGTPAKFLRNKGSRRTA